VGFVNITEIEGVKLIEAIHFDDSRGRFIKFRPDEVFSKKFDSVALSVNPIAGTIRGLHFQVEPFAEEKIVSCVQGSAFEAVVDIRLNSSSFGKIATFELSQENPMQIYLPKGVAHGFQTLLPETIIHYFLTSEYSAESSYSIDPFGDLGIKWPLKEILVSAKDSGGVSLEYAARKYAESLNI
jgi:dTDP-4-dehydrorhamnose 3,5-epimerase